MRGVVKVVVIILGFVGFQCEFEYCHDEPGFEPDVGLARDMEFTWLGILQYIHIKEGNPHYFRAPRVVLISRQYALCTAVDASKVPEGYALGNVIFDQYERDERECGFTLDIIEKGLECESAVLVVPIADVFVNPDYNRFGIVDSLAILKLLTPVRSQYMMPVCLPFKNYLLSREGHPLQKMIFHIDFLKVVPRNIMDELRELRKIAVLPSEVCNLHGENNISINEKSVICTTECGFHSGAPSMIHEQTGHWTLISLSKGSSACPDPLRPNIPAPWPRHIQIYPYVPWIVETITGMTLDHYVMNHPSGHILLRAFEMPPEQLPHYNQFGPGWNGHWWLAGANCYNRGDAAERMFKFYHEIFRVDPDRKTSLTYYLEIVPLPNTTVICVKVGMPYQLATPTAWNVAKPSTPVKVRIPVIIVTSFFKFQIEAWAIDGSPDDTDYLADSQEDNDEGPVEEGKVKQWAYNKTTTPPPTTQAPNATTTTTTLKP